MIWGHVTSICMLIIEIARQTMQVSNARRYMPTTRVAGVFGSVGWNASQCPFGSAADCEGQLGWGGDVGCEASQHAGTLTQPCWEKGRGIASLSGSQSPPHFINQIQ